MKKIYPFLISICIVVIFAVPFIAKAHVGYVIPESARVLHEGQNMSFLLSPFKDSSNILIFLISLAVILLALYLLDRAEWMKVLTRKIEDRTRSYTELLPWMLRLSLGIALLGAGTSGVFISPILESSGMISLAQIIIGFLLLSGFLTGVSVVLAGLLYLFALTNSSYLFGNFDFLGICIALLMLKDARPGIDDIFGIPFFPHLKNWSHFASVVVRVSIGFAMSFLAVYEKFLNPELSSLVVDKFNMTAAIPVSPAMWVLSAGLVELLVGLLLIIGWRPRLVSAVAFLVLTASFFFFQEAVYSHITLFGALSVIFASGGKKL